ncbi:MAG: aldehyde dehydrogenase family protein [Pseudomonadota bacterium]
MASSSVEKAATLEAVPAVSVSLIDNRPVDHADAYRLPVVDPDTGLEIAQLAEADACVVRRAVAAARRCFDRGDWSQSNAGRRRDVLEAAADLIDQHADELAAMDSVATGLVIHSAARPQAAAAADWFRYFARLIDTAPEAMYRQLPDTRTLVSREPVGVAALFTPWNIPLMSAALKLSAALAMGNSCVIKPSEQSPLAVARLVALLHDAGLPRGALQLVNGRGTVTGAALAADPGIDLVSFTGGEHAGRHIAGEAAKRFAKVTMELGGKSANIVFADADLERALDGAITAAFANNGQACLAGSRILVQKPIADRFIADFVDRANAIRVGRPFVAATELGPQSSRRQMDTVLAYADTARQDGAEVLTGGSRDERFGEGFYVRPTVAMATDNAARICQEEIFGPFATFLVFDDADEAVRIANDTRFGLAAYVWTNRLSRALSLAGQLRSGYVLINTPMQRERNAPFGGYGQSGLDREGGRWSLDFYSEAKTTVIPHGNRPIPSFGRDEQVAAR